MPDNELLVEIVTQIKDAAARIVRRSSGIASADDFLKDDEGIDMLDAICMMLIAIGESLKHLDKITEGRLLANYQDVDWRGAKGVRDVISHHYFDMDAEVVFDICTSKVPGLIKTLDSMLADFKK